MRVRHCAVFTAKTSEFDHDQTCAEFMKSISHVCIIFATNILGMGTNADMARVATHHIPISKSLGDLWQRIGREGRGENQTSQVIILLPYWLFDSEGKTWPSKQVGSEASQSPGVAISYNRTIKDTHSSQSGEPRKSY